MRILPGTWWSTCCAATRSGVLPEPGRGANHHRRDVAPQRGVVILWRRTRWFTSARVQVRAVTLSGRPPRTVVTVAEKPEKGGWRRRVARVRGARGHEGAGPRWLTVVVTAVR